MDITYLGHSSFRIKGKNASVVTDPYDSEKVGIKFPKVSADIVTLSHNHSDHNQSVLVSDTKKVIDGPGEYEIMGVSVIGLSTYHDDQKGAERGKNTIYILEMDGLRIAHLGDLGHELGEDMVGEIGTIDILMAPIGGFYTVDAEKAASVVREIEPSIIIPMHYLASGMNKETFGKLSGVDDFVNLTGLVSEKLDKLSVKKSDIPEEGTKIVILERKG